MKKQLFLVYVLIFLLVGFQESNAQLNKSTKAITSLSDYSFIGSGYGHLTAPSQGGAGNQKPYVPDLTGLNSYGIVNVSSVSELKNALSGSVSNKVIVVADGYYEFSQIELNNIDHVVVISKNKGKAKIKLPDGGEYNFYSNNNNVEVHNMSFIGFVAEGNGTRPYKGSNYFYFGPGNGVTYHVYNMYFADMEWTNYIVTLYGGLHSHDWTIDKSLYHNSSGSYIWYMMGWHQTIMNTVMYDGTYLSIALRGCYPPDEAYIYNGDNTLIADRDHHFLADNDWTHLIINNTFGSNYDYSRTNGAHMSVWYDTPSDESGKAEDCYFPPKNIIIANNAFIDNGDVDKVPIIFAAKRGINDPNTSNVASVNGVTIINNYTDKSTTVKPYDGTNLSSVDLSQNTTNFSNFGFNDGNRDYTITTSSGLYNKGATSIYHPNVDNAGNYRSGNPDVGAFEAPGGSEGVTSDFDANVVSCSATVSFVNKSSNATTYSWNFGDGKTSTQQNPSHTYEIPGSYNVELTVSNGGDSDTKTSSISVNFTPKPTNVKAEVLSGGKVRLTADGTATINWYDTPTGGTSIGTGKDVTVTSSSSNFYAENTTGGGSVIKGGKTDKGSGAYYEYDDSDAIWGLGFNATSSFVLKSVKVYNDGSLYTGERTIKVVDASGKTIAEKVVTVADGEQRLSLEMQIPAGTGYKLLADNKKGLWRDNSGTFSYPYDIGGVVSITADVKHDGTADNTSNYHFFYDWEIVAGATGCTSDRVLASITSLQDNLESDIVVYPNPAKNYIRISNLPLNSTVHLYNSNMQQVKLVNNEGSSNVEINFNELSSGVYFCKVTSESSVLLIRKVIIIK